MIRLQSDYLEGCHPQVLKALNETNNIQVDGYSEDIFCKKARKAINKHLGANYDIHFVSGGTQANKLVIASVLKPYEGVISLRSGHINVHETGAIEATGHKVLALPEEHKMTNEMIEKTYLEHINDPNHEHMTKPGMVYLSLPTENGLLYSKEELENIYAVCKKYDLCLFIDGARLAVALSDELTLKDVANCSDIFYIGGTKCGLLLGEAIVITNKKYQKDFRYNMKQQGAMLSKGRILGIGFYELFKDSLYLEIGKYENDLAKYAKEELQKRGVKFAIESNTNQQFIIISKEKYKDISKRFMLSLWEDKKEEVVVRFCTSFMTKREDIEKLINEF